MDQQDGIGAPEDRLRRHLFPGRPTASNRRRAAHGPTGPQSDARS